MMYSNKFVAAIKVNGEVLRESGDLVTVPFGSEYSVFLKNLNSVRIQVKVSVDGQEAIDGLVLGPNQTIDLERFVRNGNLSSGNRFKFIERTEVIEKHRGIGSEDGLIRIEYATERVTEVVHRTVIRDHYYDWYPYLRPYRWPYGRPCTYSLATYGPSRTRTASHSVLRSSRSGGVREMGASFSKSDAGITVPGSQSNQSFTTVSGFETANPEVLVIRLRGEVGGKKAQKPITVKTKMGCPTCGKKSKSGNEFCGKCGTSLSVL
jgi:hypothetical protein